MPILLFCISLMSGAILLLFGVHTVRSGVDQLWGAQIKELMDDNSGRLRLLSLGACAAVIMQGGTAVVLMAAGLAAHGTVAAVAAATVAIGAEFGSALVLVFLNFPVSGLSPALILFGGASYLWSKSARRRWFGKIGLGLGLIFLALSQISATAAPIKDLSTLHQAATYLNNDPVSAALLGLVITLAMHSSLASLLTAVAFTATGLFGASFGIAFVIGANIGSALIPLWLLRADDVGLRIAKTIAGLRCILALALLSALIVFPDLPAMAARLTTAQVTMGAHLGLNAAMLFLAPLLPLLLSDKQTPLVPFELSERLARDPAILSLHFKKNVLTMLDQLADMVREVFRETPDTVVVGQIEQDINKRLYQTRAEFAALSTDQDRLTDFDRQMDFAIRLERCGDILSGRVLRDRLKGTRYSPEGAVEIERLKEHVESTILMAHDVLASGNSATARLLVARKQAGTDAEQTSRDNHFRRLQRGVPASLSSSDEHLEIISSLKEINSKLSTIAYAILDAQGALKKTRLRAMDKMQGASE